jgi:hypothetical protein
MRAPVASLVIIQDFWRIAIRNDRFRFWSIRPGIVPLLPGKINRLWIPL